MTIKFVCLCGKHLSARDELAGRYSICPGCRSAVGISALTPTHRGVKADKTPVPLDAGSPQRRQSIDVHVPRPADSPLEKPRPKSRISGDVTARKSRFEGVTPSQIRVVRRRKSLWTVSGWRAYADPSLPLIPIVIGGMLAVALVAAALLWPRMLQASSDQHGVQGWFAIVAAGVIFAMGCLCSYLNQVLAFATQGDQDWIAWPNCDADEILRSVWRCIASLAAGPGFFFVMSVVYWINCGDISALDMIILAELTIPAIGYWLVVLTMAASQEKTVLISPAQVLQTVARMKFGWLIATAIATTLLYVHVYLGFIAFEQLQSQRSTGMLLVVILCCSAGFSSTLMLRRLGTWHHRCLQINSNGKRPKANSRARSLSPGLTMPVR